MQTKTQTTKKPLEIKNPAIAFDIYGKGAVSVTPKGLIWTAGRAQSGKNITVKWDAFINWMQSQLEGETKAKKTAKPAKIAAASRNGISARAKKAPTKSAASARKISAKKAH
jgi:hypothetical protein